MSQRRENSHAQCKRVHYETMQERCLRLSFSQVLSLSWKWSTYQANVCIVQSENFEMGDSTWDSFISTMLNRAYLFWTLRVVEIFPEKEIFIVWVAQFSAIFPLGLKNFCHLTYCYANDLSTWEQFNFASNHRRRLPLLIGSRSHSHCEKINLQLSSTHETFDVKVGNSIRRAKQ